MKKQFIVALLFISLVLGFYEQKSYAEETTLPNPEYTWYLDATKTRQAHEQGIKGKGVKILLIDDGLDVTHSEFENVLKEGRLILEDGITIDDIKQKEGENHGTEMASLIVGKTLGVAPESTIFFHKRDTSVPMEKEIEELSITIDKAIKQGVNIINISLAYPLTPSNLKNEEFLSAHGELQNKIKEAKDNGILIIAAGGNTFQAECYEYDEETKSNVNKVCDKDENDKMDEVYAQQTFPSLTVNYGGEEYSINTIQYPGKFAEALTVGAVEQNNNFELSRSLNWGKQFLPNDNLAWKSSATGSELDVVAPGTNIKMAVPNSYREYIIENSGIGQKYEYTKQEYLDSIENYTNGDYTNRDFGGTSAATAITSGVAALWKQRFPEMNAYELENLLKETATKKNIVEGEYFENQYGVGLVQAVEEGPKDFGVYRDIGLFKNHLTHKFWGISFDYPNTWFLEKETFDKHLTFHNLEFQLTFHHQESVNGVQMTNAEGSITYEGENYFDNLHSNFRRGGYSYMDTTSYGKSEVLPNGYRLKYTHLKKSSSNSIEPFQVASLYSVYTKQGVYTFMLRTKEENWEEYKTKVKEVFSTIELSEKWMKNMDANSYVKATQPSLEMKNQNDKYNMNVSQQIVFGTNKNSGLVSDTETSLGKQVGAESIQVTRMNNSYGKDKITNYQPKLEEMITKGKLPLIYFDFDHVKLISSGYYDNSIKEWASGLKNLQAPIILNPIPGYLSNDYYFFNNDYNSSDMYHLDDITYRNAYRHIVNLFKEQGATNVQFLWEYTEYFNYRYNIYNSARFYPGDDYVYYVGLLGHESTTYSFSGTKRKTFDNLFEERYFDSLRFFPNKPIIISDIGFSESNKSEEKPIFLNDMFEKLKTKYTNIRLVMWRDDSSYRINSSPTSLDVFKNQLQNEYVNTQPIKKVQ